MGYAQPARVRCQRIGAPLYKAVELLAPAGDAWKGLTLGKLTDMLPLVTRIDGTEDYAIFSADRAEDATALFVWACGDGINKPSREDIHNRVLELTEPAKYARKQVRYLHGPPGYHLLHASWLA
jgi:hypothetical protein